MEGTGDGEFSNPAGVAVASDGSVYVADSGNNRIQMFTSEGVFVSQWGTYGSGDGEFTSPVGVSVASDGSVYVVDSYNDRIQKFTSEGVFVSKWGTNGSGDGEFDYPNGVAVASDGSVYVADRGNNRIQKFTSEGVFVSQWGTYGSGDGEFDFPWDVAVASDGSVYVVDSYNDRIQKFTSEGVFVSKWGTYGTGDGEFDYPMGVAVASDGSVYVTDYGNHRIQKFSVGSADPRPTPTPTPAPTVTPIPTPEPTPTPMPASCGHLDVTTWNDEEIYVKVAGQSTDPLDEWYWAYIYKFSPNTWVIQYVSPALTDSEGNYLWNAHRYSSGEEPWSQTWGDIDVDPRFADNSVMYLDVYSDEEYQEWITGQYLPCPIVTPTPVVPTPTPMPVVDREILVDEEVTGTISAAGEFYPWLLTVDEDTVVDIYMYSETGTLDTLVWLYEGDSASPTSPVVNNNDDNNAAVLAAVYSEVLSGPVGGNVNSAIMQVRLSGGSTYSIVPRSYRNIGTGDYHLMVVGPEAVEPPEPQEERVILIDEGVSSTISAVGEFYPWLLTVDEDTVVDIFMWTETGAIDTHLYLYEGTLLVLVALN